MIAKMNLASADMPTRFIKQTTWAAKPGEWERMTRDIIEECVKDPTSWYIVVLKHKTLRTSGVLGRFMPPDFKWAAGKLIDFCDPERNRLFEPSGNKAKNCQLSKVQIGTRANRSRRHQDEPLFAMFPFSHFSQTMLNS